MKKRIACLALTLAIIANCGVCFAQADQQDLSIAGTDTEQIELSNEDLSSTDESENGEETEENEEAVEEAEDEPVLLVDGENEAEAEFEVKVSQQGAESEAIELQNEELINIAPEAVVLASGSYYEMNSTWKFSPHWIKDGKIISNDRAWKSSQSDTFPNMLPEGDTALHYITFEWDKYQTISGIRLFSGDFGTAGRYITKYKAQSWDGSTWVDVKEITNSTADVYGINTNDIYADSNKYSECTFDAPIEAYKIRLVINACKVNTNAIIHEAEVLAAATPGESVGSGDESLLIHYEMNETSAPFVYSDLSRYHLDGENFKGTGIVSDGRFGKAAFLNSGRYITVPSNKKLDNQKALTVTAWINETAGNFNIANKAANPNGEPGYEFTTVFYGKKLRFVVTKKVNGVNKKYEFESTNEITPNPTVAGNWVHVAMTFDFENDTKPAMYVNGKRVAVSAKNGDALGEYAGDTGAPLILGSVNTWDTVKARLRSYKMFNRVLDETEIIAEFALLASKDAEIVSLTATDSLIGENAIEGYLDDATGDYVVPTLGFPTLKVTASAGAQVTVSPTKVTSLEDPVTVTVVAEDLTTTKTYTIRFTEFYGNDFYQFENLKIDGSKTSAGTVKATVDVTKRADSAVKPVLVLAVYSPDGILLEMKAKDIDGTTSTVETETITLGENASECTVKAFVRDSWSGMRSLCPMVRK